VLVVVALAEDPLVHHLVANVLIEALGPAEVVATDFAANAGDRLGDAKLLGRALQTGGAGSSAGIGLAQRCAGKRDSRNRKQNE
jgi:hypothetical protein